MTRKAVVDRIEDGEHAVLLLTDPDEERVIPVEQLPEGATGGTWLQVEFDGDELVVVSIDQEETARVQARIHDKLKQLRERGRRHR